MLLSIGRLYPVLVHLTGDLIAILLHFVEDCHILDLAIESGNLRV